MAPLHCIDVTPEEKRQLLALARRSIRQGLTAGSPLRIDPTRYSGVLAQSHGNFVTLTQDGSLRGCIGSIMTTLCPAQTVAINAFNAAFNDRRFPPLSKAELDRIRIEIAVLSAPEPIDANTREEFLACLHPGEDGLLMEDEGRHAVFLPKVWEQIPDAEKFLEHLLAKAGRPADYWSDSLRFHRYRTISFAEQAQDSALSA